MPRVQKPTEVDLDTALALLEHRTRQNSDQRDRIDDGLWICLSDLAAVHDFQLRLELLRSAQDRTDVIELLKDPDMRHLNHRTVLKSHARRIADDEFKDFSVSGFDNWCKALREFLKAARLDGRNESTGKDRSQATLAMHDFWKTMREHRSIVLDYAAKKPGGEWAVKHAEADLRVLSIGERSRLSSEILETSMGELDIYQVKDPQLSKNLFGILPTKSHCKAGCTCKQCLPRRHMQAWTQISLPGKSCSSIENLSGNMIECTSLVEVIVPVNMSFWSMFKLALGHSQEPIRWRTFSAFMDDVFGFKPRTTYFNCTFEPRSPKEVLVGKEKGKDIRPWRWSGGIIFRKPAKGIIDGCTLHIMFERLGMLFAENGMRVVLRCGDLENDEKREKEEDCIKPVKVEPSPPPTEPETSEDSEYVGNSSTEADSLAGQEDKRLSNDIQSSNEPERNQQMAGHEDDEMD